jgi:hypothetical protein
MENLKLKIIDYSAKTETKLPEIKFNGRDITYWTPKADVPVKGPFTFDFATLRHGWMKWVEIDGKKSQEFLLQPASDEFTEDEANAMLADGWEFLMKAKVASTEFPKGLSELTINKKLVAAVAHVYEQYANHPLAKEGKIIVVKHSSDETGEQKLELVGFTERKQSYGEILNPIPR